MYLINSFSLNMLEDLTATIHTRELTADEARTWLRIFAEEAGADRFQSAVGHADTAALFSSVLGLPVPCNRATVCLKAGDRAIVGQYKGPRLPEGTTELPEGAEIKWIAVEVQPPASENLTLAEVNHLCRDALECGWAGGQHWFFKSLADAKAHAAQVLARLRKG